jgi:hypothetical protein
MALFLVGGVYLLLVYVVPFFFSIMPADVFFASVSAVIGIMGATVVASLEKENEQQTRG